MLNSMVARLKERVIKEMLSNFNNITWPKIFKKNFMEFNQLKETILDHLISQQKYLLNTRQSGEALELLSHCESNSTSLVFFDPQYEPVRNVLSTNYPLSFQSDYQILKILEQIQRILKPSAFCLLWVNKTLLGNDCIPLWLLKTPALKIVDCFGLT